jgi:hypothetical protein
MHTGRVFRILWLDGPAGNSATSLRFKRKHPCALRACVRVCSRRRGIEACPSIRCYSLRPTINGIKVDVETGLFPESFSSRAEPIVYIVQIKPA